MQCSRARSVSAASTHHWLPMYATHALISARPICSKSGSRFILVQCSSNLEVAAWDQHDSTVDASQHCQAGWLHTWRARMPEMEQQSRRSMSAFTSSASRYRSAAKTTALHAGGGAPSPLKVSSTLDSPPSRPCSGAFLYKQQLHASTDPDRRIAYLPGRGHEALEGLSGSAICGDCPIGCRRPRGIARLHIGPGQPLGVVREKHRDDNWQHVGHRASKQRVQTTKLNQLVAKFE